MTDDSTIKRRSRNEMAAIRNANREQLKAELRKEIRSEEQKKERYQVTAEQMQALRNGRS
jgi:hypothetical protein